ncbi:MAG: hypothetical protein ACRDJC_21005 [Thermomicrobiales bacterium]
MQNIHAHAWDQTRHLAPETVREAEIARGFPLDQTVRIREFLEDNAPFEKVVVFEMKARRSGFWVPDDYIAAFVANAPEKLLGFASCDPTQPGSLDEWKIGIDELGLVGVKAKSIRGNAQTASTSRMMKKSTRPPRMPAAMPNVMPIVSAIT